MLNDCFSSLDSKDEYEIYERNSDFYLTLNGERFSRKKEGKLYSKFLELYNPSSRQRFNTFLNEFL
jgi:hypothetical protein